MAKSPNKLNNFISELKTTNLAWTERFETRWELPSAITQGSGVSRGLTLMCEEVQIPGMVLGNKEVGIGPFTHYRNTNVGFLGNEINFTFITDVDWSLRAVFENWVNLCVDTTSREMEYPEKTWGEVEIIQLAKDDNAHASWRLHEVTPKVLNLVPMAWGSVSVARTTLIASSAYWTSDIIEHPFDGSKSSGWG
tara:strand:+ start:36 stop:617 length:582 start_codon:yes stop_codon:yes gene_type:complete